MKAAIPVSLFSLMLLISPLAAAVEETAPRYVNVSIDRLAIDTEGLSLASGRLAESIDQLALAIRQMSVDNDALSADEKQVLLEAVKSVDAASDALTLLARELPQAVDRLGTRLPQVVQEAREPIAELSSGLASARDGIYAITESLPEATANAKQLIDASLDAAMIRISTYTVLLIAVLALALIGVVWFVYRQYIDPLVKKLDALTGAPEQFANMALYMQQTSANLLALQVATGVSSAEAMGPPSVEPSPAQSADADDSDPNGRKGQSPD